MKTAFREIDPPHIAPVLRSTRWRLTGNIPTGGVTINEQFTALDDPYNLIGAIQKGTYTTSNGLFDDCYSLAAQKPLPRISSSRPNRTIS